jgi:hypothetical protein
VGAGVADGFGVGDGLADGVGVGRGPVATNPARTGKTDSALIVIVPPRICETTGVIRENWQVRATAAGSPMSVPPVKVGSGSGAGSTQFRALASARIWAS